VSVAAAPRMSIKPAAPATPALAARAVAPVPAVAGGKSPRQIAAARDSGDWEEF